MRFQIVFLLKLAKKLSQRRAIEAEIKRQNIRIRKAQSNEAPHTREGDVVFKRGIADMRHPVVIVIHGVVDAIFAAKTKIEHRTAEVVEKHGVIGTAADACFDEPTVRGWSGSFRIAHARSAPGFVKRFSGRGANVLGSFHEHRSERGDSRRREAEAVRSRSCSGSGDGGIHVEIGNQFVLEVASKLLAPFGGTGQAIFFAIPTADDYGAARADAALLQFTERARELHHRSRAARRIHAAESPRITVIAEQYPLVGKFASSNARL